MLNILKLDIALERYNISNDIAEDIIKNKKLAIRIGNITFIKKKEFEKELIKKGYLGKLFVIDNKEVCVKELIYKNGVIEIWGENDDVLDEISAIAPMDMEFFYNALTKIVQDKNSEVYGCKYIIVDSDKKTDDNLYLEKDKVWLFTMKGFLTFIKMYLTMHTLNNMKNKNFY